MQVVSGRIDRPKVHFEAPPRQVLDKELDQFVEWFNASEADTLIDPLLRVAITHLWFATLHPLDDGNGRITRLLTDLVLAQADKQSVRFYAMSAGIMTNRKSYYEILEQSQKGDPDITEWIVWFCKVLNETFYDVLDEIEEIIQKTNYRRKVGQIKLSPEQTKVLNRLLEGDFPERINTSQYNKVAKASKSTATRHLAYLVEMGA